MRVAAGILAAVLLLTSGCQSSRAAPEQWAGQVCQALAPWKSGISGLTAEANDALAARDSPGQAQRDLRELLSGAEGLSATAAEEVSAAGAPDVEAGEAIAKRFTAALDATATAYRTARDDIAALPATEEGFYDEVARIMEQLAEDYADVPQVSELDSDELRDAFDSTSDCQ